MLAIADKGGRGGLDPPPFLAYIIFEQPLIRQLEFLVSSYFSYFYIFDISMTNALIDSSLLLSDCSLPESSRYLTDPVKPEQT